MPGSPDIVLVHDAARPFCSSGLVSRAIAACAQTGAAIPGLEVTDTIKRVDSAGVITGTVDRAELRSVQTPQAFAFPALLDAHRKAAAAGPRRLYGRCGAGRMGRASRSSPSPARANNTKLTTDEDFSRAEAKRLSQPRRRADRLGISTSTPSATATTSCSAVCTCRIRSGVVGHSDADVVSARRCRCDPRCARRRRHRQAFSAERHALEGCVVRSVPEIRGGSRDASAAAASPTSTSR